MSELRKLRKSRATIKGSLTRINNSINETTSTAEAKAKVEKMEEMWKKFEEVQSQMDIITLEEVLAEGEEDSINTQHEGEREIFEKIYFETAVKLRTIIDQD